MQTLFGIAARALYALFATRQCPSGPPLSPLAVFVACQVTADVRWASSNAQPRFPSKAMTSELDGLVRLQFVVDTDGTVMPTSIKVLKSPHDMLTSSAVAAVTGWRAAPARIGGLAVRESITHDFRFVLLDSTHMCPRPTFASARQTTFVCAQGRRARP